MKRTILLILFITTTSVCFQATALETTDPIIRRARRIQAHADALETTANELTTQIHKTITYANNIRTFDQLIKPTHGLKAVDFGGPRRKHHWFLT